MTAAKVHPLLERVIGPTHLRITLCNSAYHGELLEDGEVIWASRGETSPGPIHAAAEDFLLRLPDTSEVVVLS